MVPGQVVCVFVSVQEALKGARPFLSLLGISAGMCCVTITCFRACEV